MDPILIDERTMGYSTLSRPLSSTGELVDRPRRKSPRTDQIQVKVGLISPHDQSLQPPHLKCSSVTKGQPMDRIRGLHIHAHNHSSTSTQLSLQRRQHPSNAPSDLTKPSSPPQLPRFALTKHSMLLLSCLLFFICNSVPIVSCASRSPFTGANNSRSQIGDVSSIMSGAPVTYNRRAEPESEKETNLFGPLVSFGAVDNHPNEMKCLFYNRTQCEKTNTSCGETYQVCHSPENGERGTSASLCYALWRFPPNATEPSVEFKGCWLGLSKDCISKAHPTIGDTNGQCVQAQSHRTNRKLFFCCCTGEMCNQNVHHVPLPTETTPSPPTDVLDEHSNGVGTNRYSNMLTYYLLMGLGFFFLVGVVSGIVFTFGKCRQKPNSSDMPGTNEPLLDGCNSGGTGGYIGINPVKLKEIRAQGKFGSVWQATDGRDNMVAVKVFNLQDRSSWQIEKDVYSLPQMKHNNILNYLGAERRGEGLEVDYWLITEYHPNGSLWDFLKSHTVNFKQLLTIIQGIGKGLTHLHEEFPPSATEGAKPSVAHRDFKSKNVLLSTNFRACIADFGLAIVFHPNTLGDAHGQVGTRRYMAPEVLEGAINFNRDSFLRIDMYACGLVLWELMSRCCFGDITCAEYRLPFEDEVGTHPTLEDMQEVVSQQKKRPKMADAWFKNKAMALIAQTVQDCWDQDAEARISASTICERIHSLITNEDNCLSVNNHTNTATYRVPPPAFAGNAVSSAASSVTSKNSFLMTAQTTNGQIPSCNSNGSAYALRETST